MQINIPGFTPIVTLLGVEGQSEIVPRGAYGCLKGNFQLRVVVSADGPGTFLSSSVNYKEGGEEVTVVGSAEADWQLRTMPPSAPRFDFNPPVKIQQPDGSGPWLQSDLVWIVQELGERAHVSLHTLSVSLLPDQAYDAARRFTFPNATGPRFVELRQAKEGKYYGFFLQPQTSGFKVSCGSPSDSAILDHVKDTEIRLTIDAQFKFEVDGSERGMADLSTAKFAAEAAISADATQVMVRDTTRLELSERDVDDTGSTVNALLVEAAGDWMSAVKFVEPVLNLRRRKSETEGPTERSTRVFGPSKRFSFHLPLTTGKDYQVAQFVYRDEQVDKDVSILSLTPRDAHYGVRVEGFGWGKGGDRNPEASYAKLDASYLLLDLRETFEYRAGGPLTVKGKEVNSVLVPKPNRTYDGSRILEMPLGSMVLKCDAGQRPVASPIILDTRQANGQLQFKKLALVGPPVGASASEGTRLSKRSGVLREEADYAQWVLRRKGGDESMSFDVTPEGVFPTEKGGWLDAFRNDSTNDFKLLEHPGAKLSIDAHARFERALAARVETKLVVKTETVGTTIREKAVYSAIFAVLSYPLVKHIVGPHQQSLSENNIAFQAIKLDEDKDKLWVKKNEGPGKLVVVYYEQDRRIKEFIDDKKPPDPSGSIYHFIWPLTEYLAVLLWYREKDKPEKYCYQLADDRGAPNTGLAFDFSNTEKFGPSDMGWAGGWKKLQDESPDLWPRRQQGAEPAKGARLDPSDEHWRGIMFRDMPVTLVIPERVLEEINKFEFLKNLFSLINNTLVMEYGWKDESGATWKAGAEYKGGGSGSITPGGWDKFIQVDLLKFTVKGAAGKIIRAEGELIVKFPLIKKKNSNDPIQLKGSFSVNLSGEVALEKFELVPDIAERIDTPSIPGFEKIELIRFSTDFKSGRLYLRLYPEEALATALPFLKQGQPLDAQVAFSFSGTPTFELVLILPAETQTNLFNKWQMSVQGVRVRFEAGGSGMAQTIVACRLNLGLPGFSSVGGLVVVTKKANEPWDLKLLVDRIGGSLDLFGFHAALDVKWATLEDATKPDPTGLPQGNIDQGTNRDIWGTLALSNKGGFMGGPHSLSFRVGTKGEMSYWVAALRVGATIGIGTAKLSDPALILARNADFKGTIAKELADAANDVMQKLRPEIKKGEEYKWIANWEPSDKVGMFVGFSGFLSLHETVLSSPEKEPDAERKYLTAFGITSTGLIRIDAAGVFMKNWPLRFSLGLDLNNKILTAAVTLMKEVSHGEFAIQPGQLVIGVGYGSKRYFLFSIGWPSRIGGDEFERDWSKSVMVRWDNAWPVNTFWGGYRAEYNGINNYVSVSYAVRAGWTKKYEKELAVLKGNAELGVAVGGVYTFRYSWGRNPRLLMPMRQNPLLEEAYAAFHAARKPLVWSAEERDLSRAIVELQDEMEATLEAMMRSDFSLDYTYYADIWGSASGSILGVTIASVEVRAFAALHFCAGTSERPLVSRVSGRIGFTLKFRILCYSVEVSASVDIVLIDGPCYGSRYFAPVPSFDEFILTD